MSPLQYFPLTLMAPLCLIALGYPFASSAQHLPVISAAEVAQLTTAPRPPESALKMTYGGMTGLQYHSNIYRERGDQTDDFVAVVSPGIRLRSDLDQHAFNAKASLEAGHFLSEEDNDYLDADLRVDSRYDLPSDASLDLHGQWRYDHVDVGGFSTDLSDFNRRAKEPTPYAYAEAGALLEAPINQDFLARAGAKTLYYNYGNVDALSGGRIIQDDRDRYEVIGTGTLGYRAAPAWLPFFAVEVNTRRYDKRVDATALYERDSSGVGVFAGGEYKDKKVDAFWASGRIGYLHQDYDNRFLPDVDTLGLNVDMGYRFNPTTYMTATALRSVAENTLFGASAAIQTDLDVTLFHDLAQEWHVDTGLRYTINDFQINNASGRPDRTDDLYTTTLGLSYDIATPMYVRSELEYAYRDSDEPRARYIDSSAILSVGMTY